jgi:N-dimethylarginine dimethylaminohydrolase
LSIQDQISPLRRVYVRPPIAADLSAWDAYGWRSEPDPTRAGREHEAFRAQLERAGATVEMGSAPAPGDPDAIYAYDPVLPTDAGAILLRPGKEGRRAEPDAVATDLEAAGIAVAGRLEPPATAEGGDLFWLDRSTLLAGRGYRTNDDGIAQLRALLGGAFDVVTFDLPHFRGPDECLHLMSFISPLDVDLVVAFLPMLPVRLLQILRARDIGVVEVPDDEFASMGPNVLALGPRIARALAGSPETRRRMEAAGVDVRTYEGTEISQKGEGGPTCLTRPLERG